MLPHVQLEHDFAEWIGFPPQNVVSVASGSAALHLSLEALHLPSHAYVMCPEFAMIAIPRAVVLAGLRPAFVDCRDDLNIDSEQLPKVKPNWSTIEKALIVQHTYGRRCDMDAIADFASKGRLHVIEDLAEAHGVMPHKSSTAACWSFYRNKTINGAEGGIIAFRETKHADRARRLRCLGFTDEHDFLHEPRGVNARMSDIHAELILKSLHDAPANIAKRNRIAGWYDAYIPEAYRMPPRQSTWMYDVRIAGMTQEQQNALVATLKAKGIAARHAFKPCSEQPEFRREGYEKLNAYRLSREVMYLPIWSEMGHGDVERIAGEFLKSATELGLIQSA